MKIATYTAIYRKGNPMPVALFLEESDAREWHANPEIYSNARRQIIISPQVKPLTPPQKETAAQKLLRILVTPGEDPQDQIGRAIEAGQKLLGIKSP